MNKIDTSQLLVQMRAMAAAAQGQGVAAAQPEPAAGGDFGTLLKQSLDNVNELKKTSSVLADSFVMGDPNISLAEVMIAKQKAGIAMEATIQVRNKLVDAYKQVMAMQV